MSNGDERQQALDRAISGRSVPLRGRIPEDPRQQALNDAIMGRNPPDIALRTSLSRAAQTDPGQYAQALQVGKELDLPANFVIPDLDRHLREARLKETNLLALEKDHPHLAQWLRDADNAALTRDHIPALQTLDKVFRKNVLPEEGGSLAVDYIGSIYGGGAKGVGGFMSGLAKLNDTASNIIERGLDIVLPDSWMNALRKPMPWWLAPSQIVGRPGKDLERLGSEMIPPPDRQTIGTDIAEGIGQLGSQLVVAILSGGASSAVTTTMLLGQGANIMAEKTASDNAAGPLRDAAIIAGAGITALTERFGLDRILNRVPPKLKNRVLRYLADIAIASGTEVAQEVTEGLAHDLTRKILTHEKATIGNGLLREGVAAGGAAGIFRMALGLRTPRGIPNSQRSIRAEAHAASLQSISQTIQSMPLKERSPEKLKELIEHETKGMPGEMKYIAPITFRNYAESKDLEPDVFFTHLTGNRIAYEEAILNGQDLVISTADWATKISGTEHEGFFQNELRAAPFELNAREAGEFFEQTGRTEEERRKIAEETAKIKEGERVAVPGAPIPIPVFGMEAAPTPTVEAAPVVPSPRTFTGKVKEAVGQIAETVGRGLSSLGLREIPGLKEITPKNIREMAGILATTYRQRAQVLGVTPEELFEKDKIAFGILEEPIRGKAFIEQAAEAAEPRRGFTQELEDRILIAFTKNANFSTWLHEVGHTWLILSGRDYAELKKRETLTETQKTYISRADELLSFLGVKSFGEIAKEHQEKFAQAVEDYFAKGKAPSSALRSMMETFKRWMLSIYGALRGQKIVDPRVAAFLDRLLASEEEIIIAKSEIGFESIFDDPAAVGLSETQAQKIQDARDQARMIAVGELSSHIVEGELRKNEKWWQEERERVKDEVTKEIDGRQEYIAASVVKFGATPDGKPVTEALGGLLFNRSLVETLYGEATANAIPKEFYAKEGGYSPDAVNQILGAFVGTTFDSGDTLVNTLSNLENRESLIERLANERMLSVHGDPLTSEDLSDRAHVAIHNDQNAELLRLELETLASQEFAVFKKLVSRIALPVPTVKEVRVDAELEIGAKTISEVNPNIYLKAEQRSAKEAVFHFNRGDFRAAFQAKERQLKNHELYRAAQARMRKVEKEVSWARKFNKESVLARIGKAGGAYLDQLQELLERFDFKRRSLAAAEKLKSLKEFVENQIEQEQPIPYIPARLLDEAYRKNYKDMTFDEFDEVIASLHRIENFAALKNKLLASQAKKEFDAVKGELIQSAQENSRGKREERIGKPTLAQSILDAGAKFLASMTKLNTFFRRMDGWKDGQWIENLMLPFDRAANSESVMNAKATEAMNKMESLYSVPDLLVMSAKKGIPGVRHKLSHWDRLMIVLNTGNEDNLQKLKDGYGFSDAEIKAIQDSLDERDWKYVTGIWGHLDGYWPSVEALAKRVDGIAPEKVQAMPIQTRFGTISGGYFPLVYAEDVRILNPKEAAREAMDGKHFRGTTRHGHRENRVKGVQKKILLETSVIYRHLRNVIHDLTHYETLVDAYRLIGDREIAQTVMDYYGNQALKEIKHAIDDIAAGYIPARNAIEKGANYLRRATAMSVMGFRITTALKQPFGLIQAMERIGAKWVIRGMVKFIGNPAEINKTIEWVQAKSEFMKFRSQTQQRELVEAEQKESVLRRLDIPWKFAYVHIGKMQALADYPVWVGAYEKSMSEAGKPKSEEEAASIEEKAVALSDRAVIDSQGSGLIKDLSSAQRMGPLGNLLSMFYTFANARLNRTMEAFGRVRAAKDVPRLASDLLFLYWMPTTLMYLASQFLSGGDDDEEKSMVAELLKRGFGEALGDVVGFRELAGPVMGYQYRGPAGFLPFQEAGRFITQAQQGELDEALIRAGAKTIGLIFNMPIKQIEDTIEGISAYDEGDAEIQSIFVGPPRR